MVKQILVVLFVAVIVLAVVRIGRARRVTAETARAGGGGAKQKRAARWPPSAPALVGYSLVVVMILAAAGAYYFKWQEANTVVTVEVLDTRSGDKSVYYVRKKALGEREFRTVDGRYVSLGAADRMERIEP